MEGGNCGDVSAAAVTSVLHTKCRVDCDDVNVLV